MFLLSGVCTMDIDKVLLVTLWGNKNYGNKLQAIALKRLIENSGFRVECARYNENCRLESFKRIIIVLLGCFGCKRYRREYLESIRERSLHKDSKMYLSPMLSTIHNFDAANIIDEKRYICAVVGSDQVWHCWTKNMSELSYFYLDFIPAYKRIAYAASFGFDSFPENDREIHMRGLQEMRYISCREETGCNLVKTAIGKDVALVLDPTLCVEEDFWTSIEKKPAFNIPSKYILKFFLGTNSDCERMVTDFAASNRYDIVDLFDLTNKKVWRTGVGSFLWIIHHADLVCTDSFHCTVFSILFERPFQVFKRKQCGEKNMYNRIETLLKITNLEDCQVVGGALRVPRPDFLLAKERLNVERYKSNMWLSKSLNNVHK